MEGGIYSISDKICSNQGGHTQEDEGEVCIISNAKPKKMSIIVSACSQSGSRMQEYESEGSITIVTSLIQGNCRAPSRFE